MNLPTIILCTVLSVVILFIPRRSIMLPLILAVCLVPMNQRIVIVGLDFTVLRILVVVCMLRLFIRNELKPLNWNSFDKLIVAWQITGAAVYILLWGTSSAVVYKCGSIYDSIGIYWIFRQVLRSFDDISHTVRLFAVCAIFSAPLIAAEKILQTSFYEIFGPVGAQFHRGRFRCAGPFPHYIMMGLFWASLLPLFYGAAKANKSFFYWLGIMAAFSCTYYSASSTPLITIASMVSFWLLYKYRMYGKIIFLGVLLVIFSLHIVMKAPVWHLMSRVDIFGGSTGYHRYMLFNQFIEYSSEWFLLGTKSTAHWGFFGSLIDITNQYVLEAVRGGFITLIIFVLVLYKAVKIAGQYSLLGVKLENKWLAWGVCVSLLGHTVSFWGASYFGGQMIMLLFLMFAIVGFIQEQILKQQI